MAELAEYQHWLREGIKAGAAGDPRERYLAHLAQYGEDAPFYGGKLQFGNLQYRANRQSNGRDLGAALSSMSGAELQTLLRNKINARPARASEWNDSGQEYQVDTQWAALNPRDLAEVDKIDPTKRYAYAADDAHDYSAQTITGGLGQYREVSGDFDVSKFSGSEIIRPGELDNFVNGVKKQYGEAFDSAWNQQIEPKLRKAGANGDLGAVYDKAKANYLDSGIPWQNILKYDENIGLYAPMGSVKHVDDQGGGWNKYGGAWVKAAFAVAATLATAGSAAPAIAGAVGGTVAGATGSAAAGTAAGTIAAGAAQGIAGNVIGSGLTRTKINGKGLATSAIMGGLAPYANQTLAPVITRPGTTALLETTRQALTNKGRVDPRLVLATVAGSEATHWAGDQFKNAGLAGKFVGGVAGGAVRQGISGGQIDPASLAFAGVGNTGAAGSMMARAASTYQRQQALRQYLQQRRGG